MQLTEHFSLNEFLVTNHNQALLREEFDQHPKKTEYIANLKRLATLLEKVRQDLGAPIHITSGWRSQRVHSAIYKNLGKNPPRGSFHLSAQAADIVVPGYSPREVQAYLDKAQWQGGLGYGKTFTHVDIRGYKARFPY